MAQLIVSAAGAAIGGAIGGPVGARIGWMVGSLAGAALFSEKQEGPKIEDGKFSSSIYGQPIPLNFGTMRHATQLAWWSGLIVRTEEVGGKGGGGAEVEKARMNLLLAVCEGPQAAVLRIWANGRLIATFNGFTYDVDEEVLPAGEVRVYLGTDTQTADPTYEAAVGTENAVPYRGTVMVAIDGLEGAEFGNRPPNIEVEVAQDAQPGSCSAVNPETAAAHIDFSHTWVNRFTEYSPSRDYAYVVDTQGVDGGQIGFSIYDVSGPAPVFVRWVETGMMSDGGAGRFPYPFRLKYVPSTDRLYAFKLTSFFVSDSSPLLKIYDGDGVLIGSSPSSGATSTFLRFISYNSVAGTLSVWGANASQASRMLYRASDGELLSSGPDEYITGVVMVEQFQLGFVAKYTTDAANEFSIYQYDMATDTTGARVTGGLTELAGIAADQSRRWSVYDPTRQKVYFGLKGLVAVIDMATPSAVSQVVSPSFSPFGGGDNFDVVWMDDAGLLMAISDVAVGATRIQYIDPDDWSLVKECSASGADSEYHSAAGGGAYIGGGRYVAAPYGDKIGIFSGASLGGEGVPVTLQSIVEDLCDRSGLPASNLDATAGTDLVSGFKVARQTSARAAIDTLRPAYFFDMPEIGEQIVLAKRGAAAVATIDAGELGAVVFQLTRGDPEPAYELEHVEEQEIPRRLELTYVDAGADYDPGVQVAERQVGESAAPLQIEVPVSLTAEQAARIAWANLMLAHASKSPMRLNLSHAYDALVPSNCINVPHASGNLLRVRVEQITRARPLLEVDGVLDEQSVYTFQIGGVPRYQGPRQSSIGVVGDTLGALLDVPPLRDQDDALVIYAGMARDAYDSSWTGASLYKSIDGGSSYSALYSTTSGATIGTTSGALGDWTGGNQWDTVNTLTVVLTSGTFSSATDEAVLNGANAVAVKSGDDWEIVQFGTATLVDTNTWELTRLLRGRKGTERCIAGHAAGDRVILLSVASLRALEMQLAEIGVSRSYKPVTSGQAVADATAQLLTLVGRSLMPLAPVYIQGARDMSNNLTLTWLRRSRIFADLPDLQGSVLDEPTEEYEIDIHDGATVVRTITASTTTASYTAAEQTADGLTPGDPVVLAIYQISSRIGRGHAGEATV